MDLAGISSRKKARTWYFIGVTYLVTKKITVDNVAEGRGKPPAVAVGTICNLWGSGTQIYPVPLMRIIYGVSILFGVLMWVSGWPAYASADTGGTYRFDGSKSQHTGSIVGRVWLVGAYERPTPLKVFK